MLDLDFSQDYDTIYDFPEAVTFTCVRTAGNLSKSIAKAFRAQTTEREQAPTGGVYAGFYLTWLIPEGLLHAAPDTLVGKDPKPGDKVTDADGNVWTLLTADHEQLDNLWSCTSVNLILAADLRQTVTIKAPSATQDAAGSRTPSFSAVYSALPARIQEQTGEVTTERGKRGTRKRFTVYLTDRPTGLTVSHQVVDDATGTVYAITGWSNPDRIDELMQIAVETVPA